ncbi:addiction module protein [Termitidicoccus mucosus]|uniref:addiction module protein n=2 Tax=Termitidicoccus mucosus TaxID=1184151 RepID=UPI0009FBCFA3
MCRVNRFCAWVWPSTIAPMASLRVGMPCVLPVTFSTLGVAGQKRTSAFGFRSKAQSQHACKMGCSSLNVPPCQRTRLQPMRSNCPPRARARLAAQLLESIDARRQVKIDAVWAHEVEARIDAHDAGQGKTVAAAEVLAYRGKR